MHAVIDRFFTFAKFGWIERHGQGWVISRPPTSLRRPISTNFSWQPIVDLLVNHRSNYLSRLLTGHNSMMSHCNQSETRGHRAAKEVVRITSCVGGCHNVPRPLWWPWPLDLESGVRVALATYLCANFSLPRHDLGPMYATDIRQASDVKQHHRSIIKDGV